MNQRDDETIGIVDLLPPEKTGAELEQYKRDNPAAFEQAADRTFTLPATEQDGTVDGVVGPIAPGDIVDLGIGKPQPKLPAGTQSPVERMTLALFQHDCDVQIEEAFDKAGACHLNLTCLHTADGLTRQFSKQISEIAAEDECEAFLREALKELQVKV